MDPNHNLFTNQFVASVHASSNNFCILVFTFSLEIWLINSKEIAKASNGFGVETLFSRNCLLSNRSRSSCSTFKAVSKFSSSGVWDFPENWKNQYTIEYPLFQKLELITLSLEKNLIYFPTFFKTYFSENFTWFENIVYNIKLSTILLKVQIFKKNFVWLFSLKVLKIYLETTLFYINHLC